MCRERRHDLQPDIRQWADRQWSLACRQFAHQRRIVQTRIAVVDALDVQQFERLADIGRRALLAGMRGDAETTLAAGAKELR